VLHKGAEGLTQSSPTPSIREIEIMGLWDTLRGEFIDVIEWTDDSSDTLVFRFERHDNAIKYGAKLIVREGQTAVFVNEGQVADVLGPGTYELETKNLPVLTTLRHWDHGFQSPFKAEVYFCSTRRFTDLRWGTANPVTMRDPEFGPVRIRAFGTYVMRILDAARLLREIVGTDGHFTLDEITDQLRNLIVSRFSGVIASARIPVLDMAASYDQLSRFVTERIAPELETYGLELTKLLVENISLPPAVEEVLDKRTGMGIVGNLDAYLKFQSAEALEAGAANPGGGGAADAMGMGLGLAMAQKMGESLGASGPAALASPPTSPPPLPTAKRYHVAVDNQPKGPFAMEELRSRVAQGRLDRGTLVWTEGMPNWTPAGEVPELAGLFAASGPPPLPGFRS
jgi:membrane protease subunit (stomatin/prohibitin family)